MENLPHVINHSNVLSTSQSPKQLPAKKGSLSGGVMTYKDFIRRMKEKGYTASQFPVLIRSFCDYIKTFPVKKGTIGKILELACPDNTIISVCGKTHEGGCEREYSAELECWGNDDRRPFQNLHHSTQPTRNYNIITEIVVTKILRKEDKNNPKIQELLKCTNSLLEIIGSDNTCEYPMWAGIYKFFSRDFLNNSFNLYSGEKMIFYAINPDIDIDETILTMKVDILKVVRGLTMGC